MPNSSHYSKNKLYFKNKISQRNNLFSENKLFCGDVKLRKDWHILTKKTLIIKRNILKHILIIKRNIFKNILVLKRNILIQILMRNRILHNSTTFYKSILQAFYKHVTRLKVPACVCVFDVCWDSKFSSKTTARPEGWWDLYVGSRECSGGSWVSGGGHLKCHAKEGQGFPSKRFWSFIFPPLHVSDLYRLRPLPCCQIVTTSDRYRAARSLPPQTVISSLQHIWWGWGYQWEVA